MDLTAQGVGHLEVDTGLGRAGPNLSLIHRGLYSVETKFGDGHLRPNAQGKVITEEKLSMIDIFPTNVSNKNKFPQLM